MAEVMMAPELSMGLWGFPKIWDKIKGSASQVTEELKLFTPFIKANLVEISSTRFVTHILVNSRGSELV